MNKWKREMLTKYRLKRYELKIKELKNENLKGNIKEKQKIKID